MVPAIFFMTFSRSRSRSNAFHTTFRLYFISLHIETKTSCLKGVNALSFIANCHSMKKIRKKTMRKNGFWRALASILRVFAVFFPPKNDENRTVYGLSSQKF